MLLLGCGSGGIRWDKAVREGKGPGTGTLETEAEGRQNMAVVEQGREGRQRCREDRTRRGMCPEEVIVSSVPVERVKGRYKAALGQGDKKVDKEVEIEAQRVADTAI